MPIQPEHTLMQRHPAAYPLPSKLRHTYVVMRHGFSKPNERGRICSTMVEGVQPENGLNDTGRSQSYASAARLAQYVEAHLSGLNKENSEDVVVVSSPFARARETAEIVCEVLATNELVGRSLRTEKPRIAEELRERHFGEMDGQSDDKYVLVWKKDIEYGDAQEEYRAESCLKVWQRVYRLIMSLEERLRRPSLVVLVAHGDTLQITQTGFDSGCSLSGHRLRSLVQAEWRVLTPNPDSYPVIGNRRSNI
jgi:broad specificity phosphatase PhoE